MQTLKTALVVVALLAVLFVAYQYLNHRQIGLPMGLAGDPWNVPAGTPAMPSGVNVEAPPVVGFDPLQTNSAPAPMASHFPNAPAAVGATAPSSLDSVTFPTPQGAAPSVEVAASLGSSSEPTVTPATYVAPALELPVASSANPPAAEPPQAPVNGSADIERSVSPAPLAASSGGSTSSSKDGVARYTSPAVAKYAFEQAWRQAELYTSDGQLARALLTLSAFYRSPDLDEDTHKKLNERLDQLAGTVIYSTRHLLEEPYKVRRGETLEDIAKSYNVSVRLLQNINSIRDPNLVLPGTELKVLRGPFRAVVELSREELTLFLGGLYAGRFPLQIGANPPPQPGEYQVLDIQPGRTYFAPTGQALPAGAPANPYGQWWLDLGRNVCIHGTPDAGNASPDAGCLGLAPRDAADVAAILTVGSTVVIR